MTSRKTAFLALLLALCLLCTGCRVRTTGAGDAAALQQGETGAVSASLSGQVPEESTDQALSADDGSPGSKTVEDPGAARREYDDQAQSEIVPGTDRMIQVEGEGSGMPRTSEEAAGAATILDEGAEKTALQTVNAEQASQLGVSQDADEADSAMTYYTVLLQDRLRSLFECQRLNLYWETDGDHITIYKTSPEHDLILSAGCYDVSARLLPENLQVDDGWVVRKNPGIIVKIVNSSVLGSNVFNTARARSTWAELTGRPDWNGIDAVRSGRVLLLSQEMLQAAYLQTAAAVLIAQTADPTLFADVDDDKMLQMLMEEATGTLPAGILYYRGQE